MTYDVDLEHRDRQPAAVIREVVARDGIPEFLAGAFGELFASLPGPPTGPPFARHRIGPEGFSVTAGVPVEAAPVPVGRVQSVELSGGAVAVTMHRGSYEGLPEAYDAVTSWIAACGLSVARDPWEAYWHGPEVAEPRTLVCFPVADAR